MNDFQNYQPANYPDVMNIQPPNTTPIIRDLSSVVPMLTNTEDIISYLEHDFRGETWKVTPQDGGFWFKDASAVPVMNELGIKNVCSLIHPYVNKVALTSNFQNEEIGKHIFDLCCSIREHLATYYEVYEMKYMDIEIVTIKIRSLVYESWMSSRNEGMRSRLLGGVTERWINSPGQPQRGLFGGKLINGIL